MLPVIGASAAGTRTIGSFTRRFKTHRGGFLRFFLGLLYIYGLSRFVIRLFIGNRGSRRKMLSNTIPVNQLPEAGFVCLDVTQHYRGPENRLGTSRQALYTLFRLIFLSHKIDTPLYVPVSSRKMRAPAPA